METLAHWFGPLHPPMTHFPIVCSILALAFYAWGLWKKKDWPLKAAGVLWALTFLSAIPSVLLGHLFAFHLGLIKDWSLLPPDSALKGQLRFHAILGTLAALLSILPLLGAFQQARKKPWPKGLQLFFGLVLAALCGVTGHEGGEMVYGSDENPKLPASPNQGSTQAGPGGNAENLFSLVQYYRHHLVKVNIKTWNSRTHGHRWVNTYVSKEAVEAYKNSGEIPEGAFVVKESFENIDGKPSQTEGPLYLMRKGKLADSPNTGGWQYALRWEKPVAGNPESIMGPVTWLPGDPNLSSCVRCHSHFRNDDYLGGIPDEAMKP